MTLIFYKLYSYYEIKKKQLLFCYSIIIHIHTKIRAFFIQMKHGLKFNLIEINVPQKLHFIMQ